MKYAIGIDIGGTNIKGLALTPRGRTLIEVAGPTGATRRRGWEANVRVVFDQLTRSVGARPCCIGLAAPGLTAKDQRSIAWMRGRLPGLEGLVWRKFFRVTQSVLVLNDAQAALLGEVWRGAARGKRDVLLLTLGTGVGGAAMVDGALLRGHIGRAGHVGHISLDPAGARDIVNTPGSLEDAIGDCTVTARSGGRFDSTRELVAAVVRRDVVARRLWLKSVEALAAGITSLVNVLDPEVVVIGGGIAKAGPLLFQSLAGFLARFEWRPGGRRVRIVPAKLGDRAGAFGAAWYAIQRHEHAG